MRTFAPLAVSLAVGGLVVPQTAHALPPVIAFGSPTTIDEGREVTIDVTVTDPDGDVVTWSWDTDFDGVFDELPGASSFTVPASATDGPSLLRIGVRATDGIETRTVYRNVTVDNVAPEITSHPVTSAAVRREYRYEPAVTEPAGENDPIGVVLVTGPAGMEIVEGAVVWTPAVEQRAQTFPVTVRVTDGDGGMDEQSWSIAVASNTAPTAPTPVSPVMRERLDSEGNVTLTVTNGTDPDGDPLTYQFRLSQSSLFVRRGLVGSGEVDEGADGTTSWTTPTPLEPGLWYWEVVASDGIVQTVPVYAQLVVGAGAFPDAGATGSTDAGLIPGVDAGTSTHPSGGCSVTGGDGGGAPGLFGLALAFIALAARRRRALIAPALAATMALTGCTTGDGLGPDAGVPIGVDSDFDGIGDEDEGARARVDTDGDGTADYLDNDSDGDGFSDEVEAGDEDLDTPPRDTDEDGVPDFRDLDSDENGIPDLRETRGDVDGDEIPDFVDNDDDNDLVRDPMELDGIVNPPADDDADGTPNYQDPDSDDDWILDGDEHGRDTDADGLRDPEDADSDNDGILDADEAGDLQIHTAPVDTDEDGIADFRDTDSDNDGLSDTAEVGLGTSPTRGDTDGDEVPDLIEIGAGTDPLDGTVSPRTRGDFVFVVPFEEEPAPARDTLRFRTSLQLVDVYFLFDISGSMSGEIGALRSAVSSIIGDITCMDYGTPCASDADCAGAQVCSLSGSCIEDPTTSACVANPWTGGGIYEADLENLLSVQSSPAATASALSVSTFGATEALYRAAWTIADPTGAPGAAAGCAAPMPGRLGCPAFREDAARILVAFTDENSDGSETAAQAGAALRYAGITFIGVWSGTTSSAERQALVDLARASDSLSGSGAPLVFDGADAAVVPAVSAAIDEVVRGVPLRVTIEATDEPDDAGDALQFIDHLEVSASGGDCSSAPAEDTDDDGRPDAFPALLPGTPVCWDIVPRRNDAVEPMIEPLVYRARVTVHGDGSPLDSRVVYFLVPPVIPPPELPR